MIIYKTTNLVNGKIYVGKDESNNPKYLGSGLLLLRAINKYGAGNFVKETLDAAATVEELKKLEKRWIHRLNSKDRSIGYNIADGGDGGDTISNHPEKADIAKKISNSLKGRAPYNKGQALGPRSERSVANIRAGLLNMAKITCPACNKTGALNSMRRYHFNNCKFVEKQKTDIKAEQFAKERDGLNQRLLLQKEIIETGGIPDEVELRYLKSSGVIRRTFLKSVDNFYIFFGITPLKRKERDVSIKHTEATKQLLMNIKAEKAHKDLALLIQEINVNNITILEEHFSEEDSKKIRDRFLKGIIAKEVPQHYQNILKAKPAKKCFERDIELFKNQVRDKYGKKIKIDDVVYKSISEAVELLGIDRNHLRAKLNSNKFPSYQRLSDG